PGERGREVARPDPEVGHPPCPGRVTREHAEDPRQHEVVVRAAERALPGVEVRRERVVRDRHRALVAERDGGVNARHAAAGPLALGAPMESTLPENAAVPVARPGEFRALRLGPLSVWPPIVLAPMAGVTNYPFRTLCREFGAGLYVSEMINAR